MPICSLETCTSLSHACSALSVTWFGKPEAAPSATSSSIFGVASTSRSRGRSATAAPARPSEGMVVVDDQRRVVREAGFLPDAGALRAPAERRRRDLVVDAPADVLDPRSAARRPPRVLLGARIHMAEGVDEAHAPEQLVKPGAFLRQEAGVLLVGAPVLQVDLFVGDVPVAAQHVVAPAAPQPLEVRQELAEEAELGLLALRARGTGGQVQRHDRQRAEPRLEIAALRVELGRAEAANDLIRLAPRVDRDAAVAALGGVQPL